MEDKVHFHCVYIYDVKGKNKVARYQSPNYSENLTDPNKIANILTKEIHQKTGHKIREFLVVGKDPVSKQVIVSILVILNACTSFFEMYELQ